MVGPPLALHRASHAEPQPAPPAAKREAVAHLLTLFEMSERRATTLVGADRAMIRYNTKSCGR